MKGFHLHIYLLSFLLPGAGIPFAEWKDVKEPDLSELTEKFFSVEKDEFSLKEHSSPADLAESGQGDPVFIVTDKKNNPIGVIKTISIEETDGKNSYKAEFAALDTLSHVPFKTFHIIQPKGSAETILNGKKTGLIAEELAAGNSLNHLLKKIANARGIERKSLFNELNRGVEKAALAMAELHQYKTFAYPAHNYVIKFDTDHPPGPYGIIHGDTHPGNIFYDANSDTLSFIDFGSTHLERKGAPILQDVGNFLLTLEIFSAYYKLSPTEAATLENNFMEIYRSKIPHATDKAIEFYKRYYIKTFLNSQIFDAAQSSQAKFIQSYCNEIA